VALEWRDRSRAGMEGQLARWNGGMEGQVAGGSSHGLAGLRERGQGARKRTSVARRLEGQGDLESAGASAVAASVTGMNEGSPAAEGVRRDFATVRTAP
jgi:hypothetical protein